MENTKIAWAHDTFNPWIGCEHVSPGCNNCYAETQDNRWGHSRWGKGATRERTSDANWRKPLGWNIEASKAGQVRRVFCASMCDVFDEHAPEGALADLFTLIRRTPALTWMLLTKRPENIVSVGGELPENVWLGVTAEDQKRANARLPELMKWRGICHTLFVSVEPQLEEVDLRPWLASEALVEDEKNFTRVNWVICGGESGGDARVFNLAWAYDLRDQCYRQAAFFMKQLGAKPRDNRFAIGRLADRKGENMDEWPADLRVREFPRGSW